MGQLGLGVMIQTLGGNEETVAAVKSSLGKKIKNILMMDEHLYIDFVDGIRLDMWDGGQSCCESRYMKTDDDLTEYVGARLKDFELKNAPDQEDEYGGCHEIQFLDVITTKGTFQISNHNEHNGYYGGFWIQAQTSSAPTE